MREVAKDRRALSDVASIVKKSNTKLAELKSELHELESQIILTQGNSNGKGEFSFIFARECRECCLSLRSRHISQISEGVFSRSAALCLEVLRSSRAAANYERPRTEIRQTPRECLH